MTPKILVGIFAAPNPGWHSPALIVPFGKTIIMIDIIGANPDSSGLGDVLLLTAVCKHFPGLTVQLHPHCAKLGFLFSGLCQKVEFTPTPVHTKGIGGGTYSRRMLRELGYFGDDTTPFIYTDRAAYYAAKQRIAHLKNPIVIKANCSARWKHVREFDMGYVQAEVNKLIQSGFTPIQFGISDNFTPLNGCIHIVDAPLEETAALYKAIGNYFGTDTGDLHLMVAVGGTCVVLVPEQIHPSYNPDDFCHVTHRIRRHVVPQVYCKFR